MWSWLKKKPDTEVERASEAATAKKKAEVELAHEKERLKETKAKTKMYRAIGETLEGFQRENQIAEKLRATFRGQS